jgi:hypothetical protein
MADTDILAAARPLADLLDGGHAFVSVTSPEASAFLAAVRADHAAPARAGDTAPEYVPPPADESTAPLGRFGLPPETAAEPTPDPSAGVYSHGDETPAPTPAETPEQTPAPEGDTENR